MSDTTSNHSHKSVEGEAPASSGTSSSWPVTEIGTSEAGGADSATVSPASSSPLPSPKLAEASAPKVAAADPSAAGATNTTNLPGTGASPESTAHPNTAHDVVETPVSQTFSRTKVPVLEDEGATPAVEEQDDVQTGASTATIDVQSSVDSGGLSANASTETCSTGEAKSSSASSAPQAAEGQLSAPTEPSTKSPAKGRPAFLLTRPTDNGRNEEANISQPSTPSATSPTEPKLSHTDETPKKPHVEQVSATDQPTLKITTLLSDTEQFSTSPVAVTATSPLTRAFFETDFSTTLRSPPRPGGAIITEIASDTEFTIVGHKTAQVASTTIKLQSREASKERRRQRDTSVKGRADDRAESRPRHGRRFDPAGQSTGHSAHLPFVIGRTAVSTAVPRLMRADSLRQQRLQEYDRQLEAERERQRRRNFEERQRQEEARERERLIQAATLHRRREEEARRRQSTQRPTPPAPTPPARDSPLQALIAELKAGLEADPAVYYAVRGVLQEYEEHTGRAPARASSVDEPPSRSAKLKQRLREANRREQAYEFEKAHRRRTRVSFDDETTATEGEQIRILPALVKSSREHSHSTAKIISDRPAEAITRPVSSGHQASPNARPIGGDRSPNAHPWPAATSAAVKKPASAVRRAAARAEDGARAGESRASHARRVEHSAVSSSGRKVGPETAATARQREGAPRRRHSFDSIVDYKPNQGGKAKKAEPASSSVSHRALYDGPRGSLRAASKTADKGSQSAVYPASIKFSLAHIQPDEPARASKPKGGKVGAVDSRSPRTSVLAQQSSSSKQKAPSIPRAPHGPSRRLLVEPARDGSITFDFDDFY
ncbi:hypothetical protein JCM10908_002763 [Rhodotorula pacifica]|uniref:uncharacterized protein n=1 Tax=Rhodotorula pacifica TaxID=1495444 RepID=UPI00317B9040